MILCRTGLGFHALPQFFESRESIFRANYFQYQQYGHWLTWHILSLIDNCILLPVVILNFVNYDCDTWLQRTQNFKVPPLVHWTRNLRYKGPILWLGIMTIEVIKLLRLTTTSQDWFHLEFWKEKEKKLATWYKCFKSNVTKPNQILVKMMTFRDKCTSS